MKPWILDHTFYPNHIFCLNFRLTETEYKLWNIFSREVTLRSLSCLEFRLCKCGGFCFTKAKS